jgi:hypothetical protein
MKLVAEKEQELNGRSTCSKDSPLLHFREADSEIRPSFDSRVKGMEDKYLPCHYFDYIGGTSTGG